MEEQQPAISPEDEIRELEMKLEAKKRELAQGSSAGHEKEIFREVLREHISLARPALPAGSSPTPLSSRASRVANDLTAEEKAAYEEAVRELVEMALSKSIQDAVKAARKYPYLLDELHDHLVDDYYDKLVSLRKIAND